MQAWRRIREMRTMPRMGATAEEEEAEGRRAWHSSPGTQA